MSSFPFFPSLDISDRKKLAPSLTKGLIRDRSDQSDKNHTQEVELQIPGGQPVAPPPEKERKPPSQDAPIRWAVFIVFGAVTIPSMLVVIILVALPQ
jgi:hypothetical protein